MSQMSLLVCFVYMEILREKPKQVVYARIHLPIFLPDTARFNETRCLRVK